jgi:hypothetical protein
MANIESRMSNDERHDPLHTKNATGTPAAPVSFEIHHSSFDIRYCLKIFPVWFRLGRVRVSMTIPAAETGPVGRLGHLSVHMRGGS